MPTRLKQKWVIPQVLKWHLRHISNLPILQELSLNMQHPLISPYLPYCLIHNLILSYLILPIHFSFNCQTYTECQTLTDKCFSVCPHIFNRIVGIAAIITQLFPCVGINQYFSACGYWPFWGLSVRYLHYDSQQKQEWNSNKIILRLKSLQHEELY